MYINTYHEILGDKNIADSFENLKKSCFVRKELILQSRQCNNRKDCKGLKKNKARGPLGLDNELFKEGVIGDDLKESLVILINNIKEKCTLPQLTYLANITTIWKGKGDKTNLDNDRGVFTLTVLRMIIDKVIYNEEYDKIDLNMSDSNAGARKNKGCRNHSFIVNGILHEKKVEKK